MPPNRSLSRTSGCRNRTRAPISTSCSASRPRRVLSFNPERLRRTPEQTDISGRIRSCRQHQAPGGLRQAPRTVSGNAPQADPEDPRSGEPGSHPPVPRPLCSSVVPTAPEDFPAFPQRSDPGHPHRLDREWRLPEEHGHPRRSGRATSTPATPPTDDPRSAPGTANSIRHGLSRESVARRTRDTWPDAASNHCASSTTHSSGRSRATSANRLSVARPTRKRSGAVPTRGRTPLEARSAEDPEDSRSSASIGAQS